VLQGILMLLVAWVVGYTVVYNFHDGVAAMFQGIEASKPGFLTVGNPGSSMSPMSYTTILLVSVIGFIM
jgi:SSS family solute:Na+ symporter